MPCFSLTVAEGDDTIAAMFRSKRNKQASQSQAGDQQPQQMPQPPVQTGPNGYMRVELPTFHGRTRKVVVYTTDAQGRIVKSFKK